MYLSELRELAQLFGLREAVCRACPPEDWAPMCTACEGTARVWMRTDCVLSDEQLARLHAQQSRTAVNA